MNNEIRLHRRIFLQLLDYWGGMNRDLMASAANIQRLRNKSPLPFFSQYYEEKALGTDIFAQNIARAKGDKYISRFLLSTVLDDRTFLETYFQIKRLVCHHTSRAESVLVRSVESSEESVKKATQL